MLLKVSLLSIVSLLVGLHLSSALHVIRLVEIEAFILNSFYFNDMVRGLALGYGTTFLVDLYLNHAIRDIVIVVDRSPVLFNMELRTSPLSFSFFVLSSFFLDFVHSSTGNGFFIRF